MGDPLHEAGFLTEHQLRAVSAERDVFLTACPGSGKTRAAGVRVARLAEDGLRVAACSYTNVGVEQIRHVLAVDLRRPLDARHFIGTLHGFLLRYVLYPFGHLATGSNSTPRLMGPDAAWPDIVLSDDGRLRLPASYFSLRPDGSTCVRTTPSSFRLDPEQAANIGQERSQRVKVDLARRGLLSFDDAMYWALRVLEDRPDIAGHVAGRFDELLVDEAQDTSELQLACLRALCATGRLRSLVLVGDLEQSISAYTGASREGCEALARERGLQQIEFTENHRSSQKICDVAVHFCSRPEPDRAVGEDAHCPWTPEILVYAPNVPTVAVERFRQRLDDLGHKYAHAAVLARSNALVDELNGQAAPVEIRQRPLTVGRAVNALRGGGTLGRRDLEAVDRVIAYTAYGIRDLAEIDETTRWAVRRATMRLLHDAPELEGDLRSWIRGCALTLGAAVEALVDSPGHRPGHVLTSQREQEIHLVRDVLRPVSGVLRAQTVHDIKGESRDAILVVVDRPRSARRTSQSALWSRPLRGETVAEEDAEELRIAFVALTRARRYCAVALPENCGDDTLAAFERAGFRVT